MSKKKFFKNGDKKMYRTFNLITWNKMSDPERDMWSPWDKSDWTEDDTLTENERQKAQGLGNLRLKEGQVIDMMGTKATILQWGPVRHLISLDFTKKTPGKAMRYGTLARITEDSSWGRRDVLKTYMDYTSLKTKVEAENEFKRANQ